MNKNKEQREGTELYLSGWIRGLTTQKTKSSLNSKTPLASDSFLGVIQAVCSNLNLQCKDLPLRSLFSRFLVNTLRLS